MISRYPIEYLNHGVMGCLRLKPAAYPANDEVLQRNAKIEKQLKSDKENMARTMKILLLGAGESGKSTIIKQMRIIYSNGFSEDERRQIRAVIYAIVIVAFKVLLDIMRAKNIDFETNRAKSSGNFIDKTELDVDSGRASLDTAVCDALKDIREDPGVRKAVEQSKAFALRDNLQYFYNSSDRIPIPGWLPNNQDMLQARLRTTEITESYFEIGPMTWRMIDVGGQRSERKKWIHCFEDVGCLIFVVALSSYDQCLVEDQHANQMHEAMMLFDSLANGNWFQRKPIILFWNKMDLFKEKVAISPISECFPDFRGSDTDVCAAAAYFADRFRGINRTRDREIYIHYTNAIDSTLLKATIDSVQDMIAQKYPRSPNL
ncbi:hypothetical protein VN97_g11518 [Penicillium thymicola]|uniref:Uncharacterized protein n=1 Tax=Penicillium thymicola TaxID=293382 RepID=A0AAI9T763_PENTH|nr:hypothetical protein VN97_g11518 [Penicillium thymicola]